MRKLSLAILSLLLGPLQFVSTDANAGWGYTEWGMSEREVRKASGGEVYHAHSRMAAYWEVLPRLIGFARLGKFEFQAEFYFDDKEKLTSVRLLPRRTIWCLDLFRILYGRYQSELYWCRKECLCLVGPGQRQPYSVVWF